jgi:TolB protein
MVSNLVINMKSIKRIYGSLRSLRPFKECYHKTQNGFGLVIIAALIRSMVLTSIALTFALPVFSQESEQMYIFGFVTDQATNGPLAGIRVEAINEADTSLGKSTVSDANGRYVLNISDIVTSMKEVTSGSIPVEYNLHQNYPNPFNLFTTVKFQIPEYTEVHLEIYDILGRKIRTLVNNGLMAGAYTTHWDGRDSEGEVVPAGIYFSLFRTGAFQASKKMVLIDRQNQVGVNFERMNGIGRSYFSGLSKLQELNLTIRASGTGIEPYEQRHVSVTSSNFRFDILAKKRSVSLINKELVNVSEPSATGKVYVSGLAGAIIDTIIGNEKIWISNQRTFEETSMRVDYDGGFPLITLGGIIGDQLDVSLSREDREIDMAIFEIITKKPIKVRKTSPTRGEKDVVVDARIFVYFTEPVDTSRVTEQTFTLTNGGSSVAGTIGFLNDNTVAAFSPANSLVPFTNYTIRVTHEVTDLQGIPLAETFTSSFTTGDTLIPGGQIAFTRLDWSSDELGLYVMDSDGGNLERLTKRNDVYDGYADWSPDGNLITFSRHFSYSDNNLKSDICLMNSDGTFLEYLTNDASVADWDPAVSPDGNKIIFTTNRDGNQEIYQMNINGTNVVNLTNTPDIEEVFPDWSPDGSKIVYIVNHSLFVKDILVMQNDGTNKQTLIANVPYLFPAWSPDGTEIAFASIRSPGLNERIFIMSADGTNLREITVGASLGGPSWAPDGRALTFIRQDENYWPAVARIDRGGSELKILTPETQDGSFDVWVEGPAWSSWPIRQ